MSDLIKVLDGVTDVNGNSMGSVITYTDNPNEMDDFQLYLAVRAIADMVYEYATPNVSDDSDMPWLDDRRDGGVNSFNSQTKRGLYIEFYYGQPGKIHTPWGFWNCWGSGSGRWDEFIEQLLNRLGAIIYQEVQDTSMGTVGPIYAIHQVDDLKLPTPEYHDCRTDYMSYESSKTRWKDLTERYHLLKGQDAPLSYDKCDKLDDIIKKTRGKNEPHRTDSDVFSVEGLDALAGQCVKYTQDGGTRWQYARLYTSPSKFEDGSYGYMMTNEVMPHVDVHSRLSFTDKMFKNGLIVRPAIEEELKTVRFSYD
ncbi:MAG: hypothetical protein ACKUBY_04320 [Candidatus Moraniibacteriota bacterium]|jgi:hypothetical protein